MWSFEWVGKALDIVINNIQSQETPPFIPRLSLTAFPSAPMGTIFEHIVFIDFNK